MKVLHINSYYSSGLFYKELFERQKNIYIDVFVPVSKTFIPKNFDYGIYTKIKKSYNNYDRYLFHLKHKKILKKIEENYVISKFDIMHAHSLFSNGYIAVKLKEKYSIPYIVAVRNTDINLFFKKMIFLRKVGINILKQASRVVFLSSSYRDICIDKFVPKEFKDSIREKSVVIPNGIDDYWFQNKRQENKELFSSNIKLLSVCEINKNKNIETTIKACEILIKRKIDVKLFLAGKITNKKLFGKFNSYDFITYYGVLSKEELIELYEMSDIFVMPSKNETFGLVYAEAMSQGLPLVYTENQGFDKQFPEGEVGFHVNALNEVEIFRAIEKILCNYTEISKNCVNGIEKFNWDLISNKYFELYSELCLKRKD